MKSSPDIINVLPSLTTEELQQIERKLIAIYRERKQGIIFDDFYGVLTEEEHMAAICETWAMLDEPDKVPSKRKA
jgi:hypothetical protein